MRTYTEIKKREETLEENLALAERKHLEGAVTYIRAALATLQWVKETSTNGR